MAAGRKTAAGALALLLGSFSLAQQALGLNPSKALDQYVHQVLTTQDGLPANDVLVTIQTQDGYLWIGTEGGGVARCDGAGFEVFDKASGQLPGDVVRCLLEGPDNSVWIGTNGGLVRYQSGNFQLIGKGTELDGARVFTLARVGDAILIGADPGLYRFRNGILESLQDPNGPSSHVRVGYIVVDQSQSAWIIYRSGSVFKFRDDRFEAEQGLAPLAGSGKFFMGATFDREGTFWISTLDSLYSYRNGTLAAFGREEGLDAEIWCAPMQDRDGNVWIGTSNGLARWNGSGWTVMRYPGQREMPGYIHSVYEDREGNLWLGTNAQGLHRFTDGSFAIVGRSAGLPESNVFMARQDSDDEIWIGTDDGLFRGHDHFEQVFNGSTPFNGDFMAISFASDPRDHSQWFGALSGLFHRQGDSFVHYTSQDGLPNDLVAVLCVDDQGTLWAGTQAGVACFKDGQFFVPPPLAGLKDSVFDIVQDHEGNVWLGTNRELLRYKNGQVTHFGPTDGLAGRAALTMFVDSDGVFWFGTQNGGLARYTGGRFFNFFEKDGLPSDDIESIIEDPVRSDLWMGTAKGIFRVAKKQLEDFRAGRIKRISGMMFGTSDGIPSPTITSESAAVGRTKDGRLWWGTGQGVTVVDPARLVLHNSAGPLLIQRVVADGRELDSTDRELEPGTKRLEIGYTALGFAAAGKIRFRYRLDGVDRDWFDAGQQRRAFFTNLASRSYLFRVQASADGGTTWSNPGATVTFVVHPQFYRTQWFYALCVGFIGVGVWAAFVMRRQRLEERFRAVLAERVRVAGEIHDSLAQGFASATMLLDSVDKVVPHDSALRNRLKTIRFILASNLADARSMIATLRGHSTASDDLALALRRLADRFGTLSPAKIEITCDKVPAIPVAAQQELLRICQEAINNAIKHANPRHIWVNVELTTPKTLALTVRDDGSGFDVPAVLGAIDGAHFGLAGLSERAERIGGKLTVDSTPGVGTRIELILPLQQAGRMPQHR
jgi:signal transduction histidine kinase/ligand-binding sensor domain-containing protein